ncbi:MAG TPA: sigma-54-dependent Fis family transcriptional regulator, partial [Polyangiaceae bacterium]|nr:sigma-54-dependent Fis family transcriptional regulator [Polyangiaceae bacterium]
EVLSSGRPLVSVDASRDQRIQAFQSVHLAAVSAVACVPILAPRGNAIGALYVETRNGVRPSFGGEVPTLQAFADQAAIAIENARLLAELREKSQALEERNARLNETRERLKELLGKRTARLREVKQELRTTKEQLLSHASYGQLVGQSEVMRKIYALIDRIRDTNVPVLITGESGTGKEMVARAIYEGSSRASHKMLAINCGAVPESILESELFGHTRGAFTGADRDRKGLFREADGGVLFLDEIGETPLKMQATLLRALQEQKIRAVGASSEVPVDVRVIFATNRDLNAAVESGAFRQDLLFRIQVVEIALPALRQRKEDIPLLCDHFLQRFAQRFSCEKKTLTHQALDRLMHYPFPGNVRQLENVLLSAWVLSDEDTIEASDLRLDPVPSTAERAPMRPALRPRGATSSHHRTTSTPHKGTLSEHERTERKRIVQALEETGWNRVKAAKLLDMPRRTFYRRLKDYGIQ